MSELWICREQVAKRPLLLEMGELEIRTVEELCFYLYQNIEGLDEGIMGEKLFLWLSEELALPRLAASLRQEKELGKDELWCAWFLLKEIGMYTEEELEEIRTFCLAIENKDEFERWKLKADRLLQNKKYIGSIREYRRMLQIGRNEKRYPSLLGDIWHNLGVAHVRLFLFEEAAEHFAKAYELNHREESLNAQQMACRMGAEGVAENISGVELPLDTEWPDVLRRLRDDYRKKVI